MRDRVADLAQNHECQHSERYPASAAQAARRIVVSRGNDQPALHKPVGRDR